MNAFRAQVKKYRTKRDALMVIARAHKAPELRRVYVAFARAAQVALRREQRRAAAFDRNPRVRA